MTEKQDLFIILKKIKYGEADLIIQALGANGARTSFIAKSALKSKKRFGGGILEPLHFVNLTYKEKQDSVQMKTLSEATLIEDFKDIRSSYDKLELALYILNCVSHVSLEGDHQATTEEFSLATTEEFSQATTEEFSLATTEEFSLATFT